ncbi:MAG TPA: glycosyltransferase family 4 protein [Thermoanaerobaculia bacterium]|nr:glycosyltransferase family 4 protein [Thermoanaerobaculia bacterium]
MKVVFIEFAGKGGMIHYAYQLSRALHELGADVTLLTEKEHYELAHLPQPFHVDRFIRTWDPKPSGRLSTSFLAVQFRKLRRVGRAFRYYGEWLRLIRHIRALRPDAVLLGDIRFPFDLFPLLLLRRQTRTLADICHNVRPYEAGGGFSKSRLRQFFYRRIYKLFDLVFVHFERNRAELIASFDIPRERTGVIVHGNEEIFRELRTPGVDIRARLGVGPGEKLVLFFGTLSHYKGIDILLRAFPRVHHSTGARLVLAGYPFHDFDLAAHQQLTRTLGIENAVHWVPEYIDSGDVAAWMESANVIVFPYRDIYQSGALHVAQTFGVPIVASAIGAMKDVIEHDVSGLLVEQENPDALADALLRLLQNPSLAARFGARAAADAQGRFSWKTNGRIVLDGLAAKSR